MLEGLLDAFFPVVIPRKRADRRSKYTVKPVTVANTLLKSSFQTTVILTFFLSEQVTSLSHTPKLFILL